MSNTSTFEIELLKEKNFVLSTLRDLNGRLLSGATYIDRAKVLEYYNAIDMILFSIDAEYEEVRKNGKNPLQQ